VSVGKELVTPNLSITELYVALQQLKVLCNNGSNLWLPIMGCLLGCIPTLPFKLRVDVVVVSRVCGGGRNMMGASKNLRLEGKSYHLKWFSSSSTIAL
jgi:hypothetical protein